MGYLALPEGEGPAPAVIVLQEWWGLDGHIKDVTDRFAAEGFVALAPDLYHGVSTTEPDEARKLVMALDMDEAVSEIQQAVDYLLAQDAVAGDSVGIVGFCMGGRLVLATSLVEDNLGAAVAFYGSPLAPEQAPEVKAPILGLYGSADQGIPVDAVQAMGDALQAAGVEHEIHVYDGAQHAFFNDTRNSYNAEAAADAWARTLEWFRTRLSS
jgi:carboxymethylenebutenolidase